MYHVYSVLAMLNADPGPQRVRQMWGRGGGGGPWGKWIESSLAAKISIRSFMTKFCYIAMLREGPVVPSLRPVII